VLTRVLRKIVGEARCRLFDWRHDVRTCGSVNLNLLTIQSHNKKYGVIYSPSHPKFLFQVIGSLDIDYRQYVFIDLGSGKGRVLLVASEFPFQQIIGVEFAQELHQVASNNVRRYRSLSQKCRDIRCLHQDAVEFMIPPLPAVVYVFNSFKPEVLVPVLRNIQASLNLHRRDILFLYSSAFHGHLVEGETMLRCIARCTYHDVYRVPAFEMVL
jgi:hypothetical protein